MNEIPDDQLLRRYVEGADEAAFAELARRHAGLVLGTCRRELGNATLAEDAAQAVFLLLSQKAGSLRRETSLGGWLFGASRMVCRNLRRSERRRAEREQAAAAEMQRTMNDDLWSRIEPCLNDALARLRPADREAIVLRYLEGLSLAELGQRLNLAENTARMRVDRALVKLRDRLAGAGLSCTVAELAASLEAHPDSASAPFLEQVSRPAVPHGAGGAPGSTPLRLPPHVAALAKTTALTMALSTPKLITLAAVATVAVVLGAQAARPAPKDALAAAAFLPLVGNWRGQLSYRDYQSGENVSMPTRVLFESAAEGSQLRMTARYPTGSGDPTPISLDEKGRLVSGTGANADVFVPQGLREFALRGGGTITGTFRGTDGSSPADVRQIVRLVRGTPDRLTITREVKPDGQSAFFVRNEYALERVR